MIKLGYSPQYVQERIRRHLRDHPNNECDACEYCLNNRAWRRRMPR